jgi:hypothetical protein
MIAFDNATPVDDPLVVADLLFCEWRSPSVRRLQCHSHEPPHVEIAWYCSGYTKEQYTRSDRFSVTPEVILELRRRGWVKGEPHWGYTDDGELQLTQRGGDALVDAWKSVGYFDGNEFPRSEKWLNKRRWS